MSRDVYREYGIAEQTTGEYEVDHLTPLEVGGSNDLANLWPEGAEPRPGFHEKDQVENYLHDQVCAGTVSLLEAQRAIRDQLARGLSATAAARAADHNAGGTRTHRSASSAAGASERSGDHFGFWTQTWWACHRWRPDHAWSVLLDHAPNSGRVQVHCAGSDTQDRRCGRHRVLDVGDRAIKAARHRQGSRHLQWSQHQQSHRIG